MSEALESIKEEIKKFKASAILRILSDVTWKGPEFFGLPKQDALLLKYRQFHLSLIAKIAITETNESDTKKAQATFQDLINLLNQFQEYKEDLPLDSKNSISSFLIRVSQQQFRYQRDYHLELGRILWIYNDILKARQPNSNYGNVFTEIYGMSIERFLQIAYIIHIVYSRGIFNRSQTLNICSNLLDFKPEEFVNVFNVLSIDAQGFTQKIKEKRTLERAYEYYEYNPLFTFPIINLDRENFLIPSYYEYFLRLTEGIYFDLFNKFFDIKNPKSNKFSEDLGGAFEDYVDILYSTAGRNWKREFEYGGGKKFSDFSVLEGSNLFLIELKTKQLTLPAKITGDLDLIRLDLENSIVKALVQIQKKVEDVKNEEEGLEQYFHAEKFYGLVMLFGNLYFSNSSRFRDLINQILNERKINLNFEYQIIELREFEELIEAFKMGMTWTQLLERKSVQDIYNNPFSNLGQISTLFKIEENAFIQHRFDIFQQTIINAIPKIISAEGFSFLNQRLI